MTETVTDIIVARARQPERLQVMVLWSTAGHVVAIAFLLLGGSRVVEERPQQVMTISLGGAPGPKTGGLTQMGARAVQEQAPPEVPARPILTPPAAVPPKMALPDPKEKPRPVAKPEKAPPEAAAKRADTGTQPTGGNASARRDRSPREAAAKRANTGPQPTDGNARAETPVVRGQGFGLSSAGGAGGPVQLDVSDFCCPEFLAQLVTLITRP